MAFGRLQSGVCLYALQPHRLVAGIDIAVLPSGENVTGTDELRIAFERLQSGARLYVPQLHRPVVRYGHYRLTVW
jgi:hypothetical protein